MYMRQSFQLCLTVCDPMDYIAHQAPLPMGFSRQEYWSGFHSLQIISLTQGSNLCLFSYIDRWVLYH